jgi:hypothetical protein
VKVGTDYNRSCLKNLFKIKDLLERADVLTLMHNHGGPVTYRYKESGLKFILNGITQRVMI